MNNVYVYSVAHKGSSQMLNETINICILIFVCMHMYVCMYIDQPVYMSDIFIYLYKLASKHRHTDIPMSLHFHILYTNIDLLPFRKSFYNQDKQTSATYIIHCFNLSLTSKLDTHKYTTI